MITAPLLSTLKHYSGVLGMDAFQHSFNLDKNSNNFANLSGNIVSVLQAGCFFGALTSFYVSDTL
jgi:hypothetical protein